MAIAFASADQKPVRFVKDRLIVDYDADGSIIGIEVVGYSYISGRRPAEEDVAWLKSQVIALGCDAQSDVLTLQVDFGNNAGQKNEMAEFGFDVDGRLLSLELLH